MGQRDPVLSVVVPMYNEESVLPLLVPRLRAVLDGLGEPYEVVAVDDGSTDGTLGALRAGRAVWPELRVVQLRRNCGHQAALTAGLMRARGAYVVSIDADLQDPPETIAGDADRWPAPTSSTSCTACAPTARPTARSSGSPRAATTALMRRLVGKHVPAQAGDFRLLSRAAVEALRELPEQAPVLRLVVPWLGFPSGEVRFEREERAAGRTKYPLSRMVGARRRQRHQLLRRAAAGGDLARAGRRRGLRPAGRRRGVAFFSGATIAGWPSLYIAVLFLGAVQLLCLGLLGEYVARIYTAVQGRPGVLRRRRQRRDGRRPGGRAATPPADRDGGTDGRAMAEQPCGDARRPTGSPPDRCGTGADRARAAPGLGALAAAGRHRRRTSRRCCSPPTPPRWTWCATPGTSSWR